MYCVKLFAALFISYQFGFAQTLPDFQKYVCYKTNEEIKTDGKLDEKSWAKAEYTSLFVDIEGSEKPAPLHDTKVKMLWDQEYFYLAAWLEEPHLWATYTERESIIFHENDFEIFIDPNGDTHNYAEIEINALNTIWDLLLTRPYRDRGKAVTSWNLDGMLNQVALFGTINDPTDIDSCWTIEFALPWKGLIEYTDEQRMPLDGEQWKVNFSRVQWRLDIIDGEYHKTINQETGKPFPEYNWVWSPQGVINMHQPETWGIVQFSAIEIGNGKSEFVKDLSGSCKWELRKLYYAQRQYFQDFQKYAFDLKELEMQTETGFDNAIKIKNDGLGYLGILDCSTDSKTWMIRQDGLIWPE
jgi:hypothetical protein